ncbi:MAG: HlyD family secretion protein [Flavobacteriales bacterium]|jgi:HlyD family secretion protein
MAIQDTSEQDIVLGGVNRSKKTTGVAVLVAFCVVILAVTASPRIAALLSTDKVIAASAVRIATVVRGDLIRETNAQGHIVAANSPTLFSSEPGYIDLEVKAGEHVKKGELLATIESPQLNERLAQSQSLYSQMKIETERSAIKAKQLMLELEQREDMAKVNLKAMTREKKRAEIAIKRQLISELDFEKSIDDLVRAELEYRQAKENNALERESADFEVSAALLELENQNIVVQGLLRRVVNLSIRSPVEGMVGSIQVEQRQALAENQAIITVIDLNAFELEARVAEGFADELAQGMKAKIRVNNDFYSGVITAISPEVINGQVVTRISFVGEVPGNLRQNQRLTAQILLQNVPDVLIVSRGPYFDGFRGDVFKLDGDVAKRVGVKLGETSLRQVEIRSGLVEGDKILISSLDVEARDSQILISK